MAIYLINTDAKSIGGESPHQKWLENGIATTGGPIKYGNKLGRLAAGDILVAYVSGVGVVAVGRVVSTWDGITYESEQLVYRPPYEDLEYRIKVDWILNISRYPINKSLVRHRLGWNPLGTLQEVRKDKECLIEMIE